MKTFGLKIAAGLGDAIFIAAALNAIKDKFDRIYVSVRWDIADTYRLGGQPYRQFHTEVLKLLFADPKFILDNPDKNYPYFSVGALWAAGIPLVLPRFGKVLTTTDPLPAEIDKQYIVVTTKVRQLDSKLYKCVKIDFLATLVELSKKYKIVIIGEREVEMNPEYLIYGNRYIYCIYDHLIGALKENVVDLTVPKLGITVPNIDTFKRDCSIMLNAKCVVTLGCGGNFILAAAVAKRLLAFRKDDYAFVSHAFKGVPQFLETRNHKLFIDKLTEL